MDQNRSGNGQPSRPSRLRRFVYVCFGASVSLPGLGQRAVRIECSERQARAIIRAGKNSQEYNKVYGNNTNPKSNIHS